ncbi:alpha-tocopherol transfer protein-like isoform X1 [Homalodisca vitripennis]|uniref:alpha-tocopherol transfer protein-like isoform X1 n=1 Tax=Homalodisca vitripennis TaxID=197043 RepID=UPI001EEC9D75|nr:alpha-tocopherol transfer protein-like isoform X1 [Homalodisca vitripennis]XP_046661382.1 alpha-tocopherol transfer protein-like isoform X1 [Homalodisca vitripennis]
MSIAPITEEQKKCVMKDIGYDDTQMQNKIQQVKEWMKKQPHLPQLPDEIYDTFICSFLIGTKMSTERAKYKLDTFYAMRHQFPDVYLNRDPTMKDVRDSVDKIRFMHLSEMTHDAIGIYIISFNPDKDNRCAAKDIKNLYKRITAVLDFILLHATYNSGVYTICDLSGLSASHLTELPWLYMQKFTALGLEALPARLKGIFIINAPTFFDTIYNLFKPILSEKMKKRLQILPNYKDLYKYIPKRILPSNYGGDGPTLEESSREWQKTIESIRDFLIEDGTRITDESKRPKESHNDCGQVFGVDGTFNKLAID